MKLNDINEQIKKDYEKYSLYFNSTALNKERVALNFNREERKIVLKEYTQRFFKPYKDDYREPLSYEAYISFKTLSAISLSKFRESKVQSILYFYTILNFINIDRFYKAMKELEDKLYIEVKLSDKGLKLICFDNNGYQINNYNYKKKELYFKKDKRR